MTTPAIESLAFALITADPSIQPRAVLHTQTVEDYRDTYLSNPDAMPPGLVFKDDETYWLSCGFHRYAGAKAANRASFKVEVRVGTRRDAWLAAMDDPDHGNHKNGVRLSNDDKRKMVNSLLDDAEWSKKSAVIIAEKAGVSRQFVVNIRNERKPKIPPTEQHATVACSPKEGEKLVGKDGIERSKSKPGVKGGIAAAAHVASVWDNIAPNLKPRLNEIKPGQADLTRLSEYNMDEQREIVKLVDGSKIKTVGEAIGDYEGPAQAMTPAQELANSVRKQLGGLIKTIDNTRIGIDKVLGALDGKRPKPDFAQEALDSLDEARKSLANWQKKVR